MQAALETLVKDATDLFSLPDIFFQLNEMIRDSRFSMADIGQVITKDPALSARLLRIVNSPFYGYQSRVDTISRAVTIVGIDELNHLVLATAVVDSFSKIPCELVDMTTFWIRSVNCAVIARLLAKQSGVLHAERLFLAGLLHDIGSLVLYHRMPEASRKVLLGADNDRKLIAGFEQEIIGVTHADVARELLKTWGLPESLYETIGSYLNPEQALQHKLDTHLLHMAARLANCGNQANGIESAVAEFSEQSMALVRLNSNQIVALMNSVEAEFLAVFDLLAPQKKFH